MIPFNFSRQVTWQEFLDLMLETDRRTLIMIIALTALVIYNVRNFLSNPSMCTFISPLLVVLSVTAYQLMILAEITIPNVYNNWLVSVVIATAAGSALGIGLTALIGQIVEQYARWRRRTSMPEFVDPGPNRGTSPLVGPGN
ncbi:MAG: hypothetical protein RL291_809 [Pseudomonadota bacterium]